MTNQPTLRKRKNYWPTAIVVSLTAFVAFMLGIATVCGRSSSDLVSQSYYEDGSNLKQWAERKAANAATGWNVSVIANESQAVLIVTSSVGERCDSLQGQAGFYRPSNAGLDIAAGNLHSQGGGVYVVNLPRPLEAGAWQADIRLSRGGMTFENRVPFFVDG